MIVKQTEERSANAPRTWVASAAILSGLFVYYALSFFRYRPYEVDNPWFLSFSYDTTIEHIYTDQFLHVHFPAGMDGTQLFGKLAAYVQWLFLARFGWQQEAAFLLSASLVVVALLCWWLQLRHLGYSRQFVQSFLIVAGVSEPFLSVANKFRYEGLALAMISGGLLLVASRRLVAGVFLAALAVELEPMALAGLIPVMVLVFSLEQRNRRLLLRLGGAFALAAACYVALHPDFLVILRGLAQAVSAHEPLEGGFFAAYFLRRARHWPELLCFLAAAFFYWRRRHEFASHYLAYSALLLTVFSVAMPHGNPSYIIFCYPFLIAVSLLAFGVERRMWIVAVWVLLMLPQQIYLAYLTRHVALRSNDMAQVSDAVHRAEQSLGLADEKVQIYGDYRLWFAHPHFYHAGAQGTLPLADRADLFVCYNYAPGPPEFEPALLVYCPQLEAMFPLRVVETTRIHDQQVFVYARK